MKTMKFDQFYVVEYTTWGFPDRIVAGPFDSSLEAEVCVDSFDNERTYHIGSTQIVLDIEE